MIYGPGDDAWSGQYGWNTCNPTQDNGGQCGYTYMQTMLNRLGPESEARFRFMGYGKGVMMWASPAQAGRFVNQYQDVVAADLYYYTDANLRPGEASTFLAIP